METQKTSEITDTKQERAEQRHYRALAIVNNALPILGKIRKNPSLKNFHDSKCGSQWMGEWLRDQKTKILNLYGVVNFDRIVIDDLGIPKEVENFVLNVYQTIEM